MREQRAAAREAPRIQIAAYGLAYHRGHRHPQAQQDNCGASASNRTIS